MNGKVTKMKGDDKQEWNVTLAERLQFNSTIQDCGLFNQTDVWLEREDTFSADRNAQIAPAEIAHERFQWHLGVACYSLRYALNVDGIMNVYLGRPL